MSSSTCNLANGDLYVYPNSSSTISSSSPLTVQWNPACMPDTTTANVLLYSSNAGLLQAWTDVGFASGSLTINLDPTWWNDTASASVHFNIVDEDTPVFLTTGPSGPFFTVTTPSDLLSTTIVSGSSTIVTAASAIIASTKAAATSTNSSSIFQSVHITSKGGISKGALAAAIIVPLLVVGVAIGIYVRLARIKEAEKRKRWSEHIDERMSRLSADWRAGAKPGETLSVAGGRNSMASRASMAGGRSLDGGNRDTRASSYFGSGRPTSSAFAVENNMAGAGAAGRGYKGEGDMFGGSQPEMRQVRSSILYNHNNDSNPRQSRVSFADSNAPPRMSRVSFGDALNLRPTQSNIPGLLSNKPTKIDTTPTRHSIDGGAIDVSPSQTHGPFVVPDYPSPTHARSASHSGSGNSGSPAKSGFLSTLASAVGKKDKAAEKALERQRSKEEAVESWKQAEATRRSADGIRDMEATLLRRSRALSQYSQTSNANANRIPSVYVDQSGDNEEAIEELDVASPSSTLAVPQNAKLGAGGIVRATSPMGMAMPAPGMNPDELLAAYAAARAKSPTSTPGAASPAVEEPSQGHLRPVSVASNSNNPFRQSMVSDTSKYSGADGVEGDVSQSGIAK